MTLRQYLALMSFGTAICFIAWLFLIRNVNPADAGSWGFLFFYASLFLTIVGAFSVVGFLIRRAFIKNDEVVFRHVKHTFRQSVIVAFVICVSLFLAGHKLLAWWNFIILAFIGIILETIVFTNRKFQNRDYV